MAKKKNNNETENYSNQDVVVIQKLETSPVKNRLYCGYGCRLGLNTVSFLVLFVLGMVLLVNSIMIEDEKILTYHEKSNVDYEVCYKDDEFYHGSCFSKEQNMKYIANLIDQLHLNFTYDFNIEKEEDVDFTYDIVGKLVISDASSNKVYFEREYSLVAPKIVELIQGKQTSIQEKVDIHYDEFNSFANQFHRTYGVNSESKLYVYMNVHKKNRENASYQMDSSTLTYVMIPLSQRAIDISIDSNYVDTSSHVVEKVNVVFESVSMAVVSGILLLLSIVFMIKSIRLLKKSFVSKSKYDKYVEKLLRDYDRLIGEAKNLISFEDKEEVYFTRFSELLDVHDHLGLPIMYYNVASHVKCYFYIVTDKIVYLYVVKAVDFKS
ncbi:MAG: hypothetical protein IJ743_04570 [Bacilli bacterium]|nr:hypothetical protein [Bacilli bacterium]